MHILAANTEPRTAEPVGSSAHCDDGALRLHAVPRVHSQRLQSWAELLQAGRAGGAAVDRCQRQTSEHQEDDLCQWWGVFHDPILNDLICTAYHQNLTLRKAGFRVLQARAQLGIAIGNIFPQLQNASGDYMAIARSRQTVGLGFGPQFFNQWNFGFNLAWELDFWGRFRRAVEQNSDLLNASVEDYDGALVTLLGDVATAYVDIRTLELRIKYAEDNVHIQRDTLAIVEARFKVSTISELDVDQARTTVESTEAAIKELEIALRQSVVQLCILMGMPPEDLYRGSAAARFPRRPRKWPWAFPPICCGGGPMCVPPSAGWPRSSPRLALPNRSFIRTFRSSARWAGARRIWGTCSSPAP